MRAATRVDSSGMGLKMSVLTFGAPRQYASLASSTSSSSLRQRTNLKGPVPTGLVATWASPFSRTYFGGTMGMQKARFVIEGGERHLGHDAHGERIDDLDALDVGERPAPARLLVGVQHALDAELDRLGVEVLAVVELDARAAA